MATLTLTIAAAALIGLAIVALAVLKGWQDWLALKHRELDRHAPGLEQGAGRIELADLRERIRQLEAIAAGVEL
jgi:hypothetical protein